MEELLNKLIEKGWCVFGHRDRINAERCNYIEGNYYNFDNSGISISLRELVSKSSGLWQFVCENEMVKSIYCTWDKYDENSCPVPNQQHLDKYYEYRLIESALKDESELEDFLLNNVKVDE